MQEKILDEITQYCSECRNKECCPENDCVLFRIEQIVSEKKQPEDKDEEIMKLEVGMYVRTKYLDDEGYLLEPVIAKIKDMNYRIYLDDFGDCKEEHIIKASHNIIDLIEVGDYVNGLVVTRICEDTETNKKYINLYGCISEWEEEDIKSILTKEQFESMSYKVG